MSVNSSSSNVSPLSPFSFNSNCFDSSVGNFIFTAFTTTYILLILPLFIIILHLGHQQWRQQRSAVTSPSDLITYHMSVMEMINVLSSVSYCIGVYTDFLKVKKVASYVFFVTSCGQTSFHTLTCVERYLAVIHPITYMDLKKGNMIRIRNIIIWSVWLLGFANIIIAVTMTNITFILYSVQQVLCLVAVSFCSLAVLKVLKHPGPGDGDRDRERIDQSKQRAFNTIMAIMGTLLLRFGMSVVCIAILVSPQINLRDRCAVVTLGFWFSLPSSLVLPLLFLHRVGKLPCCRKQH